MRGTVTEMGGGKDVYWEKGFVTCCRVAGQIRTAGGVALLGERYCQADLQKCVVGGAPHAKPLDISIVDRQRSVKLTRQYSVDIQSPRHIHI